MSTGRDPAGSGGMNVTGGVSPPAGGGVIDGIGKTMGGGVVRGAAGGGGAGRGGGPGVWCGVGAAPAPLVTVCAPATAVIETTHAISASRMVPPRVLVLLSLYARAAHLHKISSTSLQPQSFPQNSQRAATWPVATSASAARARRISQAPVRQIAAPAIDSGATRSCRTRTPSSSATTGIRNVVADAVVAPIRPAPIAASTFAIA